MKHRGKGKTCVQCGLKKRKVRTCPGLNTGKLPMNRA